MLLWRDCEGRYVASRRGHGKIGQVRASQLLDIRFMKYRDMERILVDNGFAQIRQQGSHRQLQGFVDGKRRIVTLTYHSRNDDIMPKTLASIIRQSGLPRRLFK